MEISFRKSKARLCERIFKDLDLVEQLGSGIPRVLQAYNKECFQFSENFLRVILPSSEASTPQVPSQIKKLLQHLITGETKSRTELQEELNLSDREYFRKNYLLPAIKAGSIALTLPDKPTSSKQQYFLTQKGKDFLLSLE